MALRVYGLVMHDGQGPAKLPAGVRLFPVRELATDNLVTAEPDMSTRDAAQLMGDNQVRRLLVCENDRLIGVASIGDIAVKEGKDRRIGDTLQEISQGVKDREF